MAKNKLQQPETSWSKLSREWSKSGMTQKEFCLLHRIDYKKFINWRYRHRQKGSMSLRRSPPVSRQKLLPVKVLDDEFDNLARSPSQEKTLVDVGISIITPSGYLFHIGGGSFNGNSIVRLLKALKELE